MAWKRSRVRIPLGPPYKTRFGEMAEWSNAPDSKSGRSGNRPRGFESLSLRHVFFKIERDSNPMRERPRFAFERGERTRRRGRIPLSTRTIFTRESGFFVPVSRESTQFISKVARNYWLGTRCTFVEEGFPFVDAPVSFHVEGFFIVTNILAVRRTHNFRLK